MMLPFTADQDDAGALFRVAAAAAAGLSGDRDAIPKRPWRSASSRREAWSAISISWKAFSATRGDPYLPENDAALDAMHWTGHTGCVILAPHLVGMKKKDLGLPHVSEATERQRRDGMCWRERRRAVQQRLGVQDHLPRPARRDGDHHRRQLLRLLQERSEDADQLRGQSVRVVRGGARRRRHRVCDLCAGPGISRAAAPSA